MLGVSIPQKVICNGSDQDHDSDVYDCPVKELRGNVALSTTASYQTQDKQVFLFLE